MAEKQKKGENPAIASEINGFVATLSDESKMLVILKRQLYGGTWEPMLEDLQNRLNGGPYIFKLANRIQDDIERIQELFEFEKLKNVDLADYVEMP